MDRRQTQKVASGVQVLIIVNSCCTSAPDDWIIRPINLHAASALVVGWLHLLAELIIFGQICDCNRLPCASHCLLKMLPSNLALLVHIHVVSLEFVGGNCITNRSLCSTLTKLGQVCATEAVSQLRHEAHRDVGRDRRLLQSRFQDALSGRLVWQWNVNQLIKSSW